MAHRAAIKGREHSTERIESRSLFRDYVSSPLTGLVKWQREALVCVACVISFREREELGKEENKIREQESGSKRKWVNFNYLQFGESWPWAPDEGLLLEFWPFLLSSTGSWGLRLGRARVSRAETEEGHPTILCGTQYTGELLYTLVPSQQQG